MNNLYTKVLMETTQGAQHPCTSLQPSSLAAVAGQPSSMPFQGPSIGYYTP